MRTFLKTLGLVALLSGCMHKPQTPATSSQAMNMPSSAEMQAAFAKAATPTAEHAMLKRFAGNWAATTKMWMSPGAQPEVSKGHATVAMTMDGKFLREEFNGQFMGKPFHGIGYTGYDTVAKEVSSTWMDSMSTSMMVQTGTMDLAQGSMALQGTMSCPVADGKIPVRSVSRIVDNSHRVFEMYNVGPDGKEFKGLEITYTRVGAKKHA